MESATSPQLGENWAGAMQIIPRDDDGLRINKDTGEIFNVVLNVLTSSSVAEHCRHFNASGSRRAIYEDVGVCTTLWAAL